MPVLVPPQACSLLRHQDGVATYAQLIGAGLTRDEIRAHVDAQRWQRHGRHCVLAHNARPTQRQVMWMALLDAPPPVALAGFSSLQLGGLRFFGAEPERLHVIVRRGATYHRFPGVQVHESRRFESWHIVWSEGVPHLPFPRSALDAAAWQPSRRYACAVLAAVVQQRICTPEELNDALRFVGRIRHKQAMRLAIHDIAGGAEALSEIDVAGLCRRFGLLPPRRQVMRRDRTGRKRYLDCEWRLPTGPVVVLEVDGSHHVEVGHWEADLKRERSLVATGRHVIRASAYEVRYEQAGLVADLVALGIPPL
jgi:hypothetical protein